MAVRKKPAPKTFKAAYQILKINAEDLQSSNEPDIDNLMNTVEQSIAAYKICQARIEAVQRALDAAFDEDVEVMEHHEAKEHTEGKSIQPDNFESDSEAE